jgi:hypothetical protein
MIPQHVFDEVLDNLADALLIQTLAAANVGALCKNECRN